jgi:hypothetical protein
MEKLKRWKYIFKENENLSELEGINKIIEINLKKFLKSNVEWSDHKMYDVVEELNKNYEQTVHSFKNSIQHLLQMNYFKISTSQQIKLDDMMVNKYFKKLSEFTHEVVRSHIGDLMYKIKNEMDSIYGEI